MRDYIILNGHDSRLVRGLLIQSLPPITKPLMRTEQEEIDGRDGDVITKLGYSAYDKTITIGLHGDYDVDDVIEFFSEDEGKVTFSNEADKYYNYQMISQIDFDKLIRFKVADVTFHVQPFKYSAVDKAVSFGGNLLTVPDFASQTKNGVTVSASDGVISVTGTATKQTEFFLPIDLSLQKGSYDLKATTSGGGFGSNLRIIKGSPTDSQSFGGAFMTLLSDYTRDLSGSVEAETAYHYVWLFVAKGETNYTLTLALNATDVLIHNYGTAKAKPVITVVGNGNVTLSLNGEDVLELEITKGSIIIDVAEMQAYKGNTYLNRYVSGNYDDLLMEKGDNILGWSGNVTSVTIDQYSRWI